jgi:hypothetical protein
MKYSIHVQHVCMYVCGYNITGPLAAKGASLALPVVELVSSRLEKKSALFVFSAAPTVHGINVYELFSKH